MTRDKSHIPSVTSKLRRDMIEVPTAITRCRGININGRKLKSFLFITDIATICNTNDDAVLAIYPFVPIIVTGSNKDENILATIGAGANAISYTPLTNAEIFKKKMEVYRQRAENHVDK